jgi:hypothetical protein
MPHPAFPVAYPSDLSPCYGLAWAILRLTQDLLGQVGTIPS